ncbi:MAG: adenine deaminase [Clostridium sp.]|uniref:adenine deaminase n=1 Tax=Clostridium sp. TaxID=1506 RepID=UPI002FC88F78
MSILSRGRDASINNEKCDLVLKNAQFINVFTSEIQQADIGIVEDIIIGVGTYSGIEEIDCSSKFISPGFIDAHIHIESSMVTPNTYGNLVINHGVTTVIADPHEIANVLGVDGIKLMMDNSELAPIDIHFMMPSCVPAVKFEENGGVLNARDLYEFITSPKVIGLGEVMDVNAVTTMNPSMMEKLDAFKDSNIDGHAPHISLGQLNQYILSGIKTDHECITKEEALEKVRLGMHVLIREGSAAKNLINLIGAVDDNNYRNFSFCTDDRHIEDIIEEGTINNAIKLSIECGLNPIKAYIMGTYNVCKCYGLSKKGAIAPGYIADLVILNNLDDVDIDIVIKSGHIVNKSRDTSNEFVARNTVNMDKLTEKHFQITPTGSNMNVIEIIPNSLETKLSIRPSIIIDNKLDMSSYEDVLKIAVFERHKRTGNYSLAFLSGMGLKNCSVAQSIAHDSHNIIVIGDNDNDMAKAVNTLIDIGGGIAIVSNGDVINTLPLEVGGILTNASVDYVYSRLKELNVFMDKHGLKVNVDAFITLSFMSLPVIPEVKLTTKGLISYKTLSKLPVFFD